MSSWVAEAVQLVENWGRPWVRSVIKALNNDLRLFCGDTLTGPNTLLQHKIIRYPWPSVPQKIAFMLWEWHA